MATITPANPDNNNIYYEVICYLEYSDDVCVVEAEELPAVDLEQLVAALQPPVLPDRPVGQDGADVVVRVLLLAVHLLHRPLQADPQAPGQLELGQLRHDDLVAGPHPLLPLARQLTLPGGVELPLVVVAAVELIGVGADDGLRKTY